MARFSELEDDVGSGRKSASERNAANHEQRVARVLVDLDRLDREWIYRPVAVGLEFSLANLDDIEVCISSYCAEDSVLVLQGICTVQRDEEPVTFSVSSSQREA